MQFDINLAKKTPSDNLPDQAENKVFSAFNEIRTPDIDDMSEALCRIDDQVIVFDHLELTKLLAPSGFMEDTFINGLKSTRSDTVHTSGTESLMSLERTNPSYN